MKTGHQVGQRMEDKTAEGEPGMGDSQIRLADDLAVVEENVDVYRARGVTVVLGRGLRVERYWGGIGEF